MNQLSKYPWLRWYVSNLKSIPGGTYRFGFTDFPALPPFRVSISPFRMGATPVTWGMWKEFCKAKSVRMPKDPGWGFPDDHPVVNVSWEDIMKPGGFCEWVSDVAGFKLTLPTSAQFEYSARGGKDGLEYPWGKDFDRSKLWCSDKQRNDAGKTAAVDRTSRIYRNGYGLTDTVGNVNQWCSDYHTEHEPPTGNDPVDTTKSDYRGIRSGSWSSYDPINFRCASRNGFFPDAGLNIFGLRLSAGQK